VQGSLYIGGDNNFDQCVAAVDNVSFAEEMHAVHVINADVTGKLLVRSFIRYCWQKPRLLWTSALRPCSGPVRLPRERRGIGRCM